ELNERRIDLRGLQELKDLGVEIAERIVCHEWPGASRDGLSEYMGVAIGTILHIRQRRYRCSSPISASWKSERAAISSSSRSTCGSLEPTLTTADWGNGTSSPPSTPMSSTS